MNLDEVQAWTAHVDLLNDALELEAVGKRVRRWIRKAKRRLQSPDGSAVLLALVKLKCRCNERLPELLGTTWSGFSLSNENGDVFYRRTTAPRFMGKVSVRQGAQYLIQGAAASAIMTDDMAAFTEEGILCSLKKK